MYINKDNSIRSKIIIGCKREGERTLLTDSFFTIPYKLTHYGNMNMQRHLEMIQMCSSPGVMDGDSLELQVNCADETEMKLFTQSYNKIHPMPMGKGAMQQMTVHLEKNAMFQYTPHPTIPYEQSKFTSTNSIYIKNSAHLIWSDIVSGGRIHSGERFKMTSHHTKTKIYVDKKLVLFDNQLIDPKLLPIEDILFFEGFTHQATFLIISTFAADLKKEFDAILLEQFTDATYGYTHCGNNLLVLRGLGYNGDALYDWILNMANMCWQYINAHRERVVNNAPAGNNKKNAGKANRSSIKNNSNNKTKTAGKMLKGHKTPVRKNESEKNIIKKVKKQVIHA